MKTLDEQRWERARLEDIRARFMRAALKVWTVGLDGFCLDDVTTWPPPQKQALAALRYDHGDVAAEGRWLRRFATSYVLAVSNELLRADDELISRVMLHEAIHIGHPRHDEQFETVAKEVGTFSTEHGMRTGGLVVVEIKEKRRYRHVLETFDMNEAERFATEQRAGPGRYRVTF